MTTFTNTAVHIGLFGVFCYCFEVQEQFFSYLTAVTITDDWAADLDLCLAHKAFKSEGSFMCHTYCNMRLPF
jgi:hypothetical protein